MSKEDTKRNNSAIGSIFVGCIIVGTAIGFMMNNIAVGAMLGVGGGFIVAAILRLALNK